MRTSQHRHCQDDVASAAADDVIELVERSLMTVIDPSMFSNLAAYAASAQSASTQQNVATARNVNAPGSSTIVSSTSG